MWRYPLMAGVAATFFGTIQDHALAASVCYSADYAPAFIRLDVQPHSRLTTARERAKNGNPIQATYSAQGMIVFQEVEPASEEPIRGTIVVARDTGARSAFDARLLFPTNGDQQLYSLDCYTEEASPTPASWQCRALVLNASADGVTSLSVPATFTRVDPLDNEVCSLFVLPHPEADTEELAGADVLEPRQ